MKIIKCVGFLILFLTAIILLSYLNHRIQLHREEALRKPLGNIVRVNNHQMSIFQGGKGEQTLVFLSGGGTPSPILDFKSLYSLLSDDYKIVVVEKFGYGFSDVIKGERHIDLILAHTRDALDELNISGPYILCPHSMSGLEALYWAQRYPEEVEAIVGLDMAVAKAYEEMKINGFSLRLVQFAARTGLLRLIPGMSEVDAIRYGTLTDEEKAMYRAVFYHRTMNETMINEMLYAKENADKVAEGLMPQVPMLLFSSNGKGTGFNEEKWRAIHADFARNVDDVTLIDLDCGHYVHNQAYDEMAKMIDDWLRK